MTYPILVEPTDRGYAAAVAGWPELRVTAPTREAALLAVRAALTERMQKAELVMMDIDAEEDPWQAAAGQFADDERLREICAEAYAARDKARVT